MRGKQTVTGAWVVVTAVLAVIAFSLPALLGGATGRVTAWVAPDAPRPHAAQTPAPVPEQSPATPAPARVAAAQPAQRQPIKLVAGPTPTGPVDPPPGGDSESTTGGDVTCPCAAASGGRTTAFTAINTTASRYLWWGPASSTAVSLAFDGTTTNTLTFDVSQPDLGSGVAHWSGTASLAGSPHPVRFTLIVSTIGGAAIPLVDAAGQGISNGSVVAVINGDFKVNMAFEANNGATWGDARTFFDTTPMNGSSPTITNLLQSSFTGGFWSTPFTAPTAAQTVAGTPGNAFVNLTWAAPSDNGGKPITGYQVTPYIGSSPQTPVNLSGSATYAAIGGLTNGTTYTFTVAAVNSVGTGSPSTASGPVTPAAGQTVPAPAPAPTVTPTSNPTPNPAPTVSTPPSSRPPVPPG